MTTDAPPPPETGLLGRALGMLTAPRATFEGVVAKPRVVGILFLVALVTALATGLPQFTAKGRQIAVDSQVEMTERFLGRSLTAEEYTAVESRSRYGGYFAIIGTFIALPVFSLIFAGLYWVAFNTIMGGTGSFKQVLAIVTHSSVPGAVGAVVGAPIMYIQGEMSQGGPFNLGALAPMLDERSTIAMVLSSTNVFMLWGLVVTAIGLAVLYRRKTMNIAIGLVVAYFLIAYTITSVVGSMFGGAGR
jgi:hypothetical protein